MKLLIKGHHFLVVYLQGRVTDFPPLVHSLNSLYSCNGRSRVRQQSEAWNSTWVSHTDGRGPTAGIPTDVSSKHEWESGLEAEYPALWYWPEMSTSQTAAWCTVLQHLPPLLFWALPSSSFIAFPKKGNYATTPRNVSNYFCYSCFYRPVSNNSSLFNPGFLFYSVNKQFTYLFYRWWAFRWFPDWGYRHCYTFLLVNTHICISAGSVFHC